MDFFMDNLSVSFAKAFIAGGTGLRDIKRMYRAFAMKHHPDRLGCDESIIGWFTWGMRKFLLSIARLSTIKQV